VVGGNKGGKKTVDKQVSNQPSTTTARNISRQQTLTRTQMLLARCDKNTMMLTFSRAGAMGGGLRKGKKFRSLSQEMISAAHRHTKNKDKKTKILKEKKKRLLSGFG